MTFKVAFLVAFSGVFVVSWIVAIELAEIVCNVPSTLEQRWSFSSKGDKNRE